MTAYSKQTFPSLVQTMNAYLTDGMTPTGIIYAQIAALYKLRDPSLKGLINSLIVVANKYTETVDDSMPDDVRLNQEGVQKILNDTEGTATNLDKDVHATLASLCNSHGIDKVKKSIDRFNFVQDTSRKYLKDIEDAKLIGSEMETKPDDATFDPSAELDKLKASYDPDGIQSRLHYLEFQLGLIIELITS